MAFITWAIFGAIVGGIAKALMPGKVRDGWLPAIGLGVAGSVIGGLPFGDGPAGFIGSVLGAVFCVYLVEWWRSADV